MEVWGDDDRWEFPPVANDRSDSDERMQLQRIFDGLGRDEFSAGGLNEIFFSIGDGQISVGVDVADVTGLEPIALERGAGFVRTIPVALENGWSADQYLSIFGDANFEVRHDLAHSADAVILRAC